MTARPLLVLEPEPVGRRMWLADVLAHREVLSWLARADFQVRYKRASLGVLWAVAVPFLQGIVLAVVFERLFRDRLGGEVESFAAYVLSGIFAWSYFAQTLAVASTAIVDGSGLTDKVWFPRVLLPLVPILANLPGLGASLVLLVLALGPLGVGYGLQLLVLIPAVALLVALLAGLSLCLSALHVYFRDTRFLVQAMLLVWFYVTPVAYLPSFPGDIRTLLELNPMWGVVMLFRLATVGAEEWARPVAVAIGIVVILLLAGLEAQRRRDRLFVDLL